MTEENQDLPVQDELEALKARADQLGISYHPSIGVDKLREKVNAALTPAEEPKKEKELQEGELRAKAKRDAMKLVRVRVTCMNPAKRELPGEVFTVGNSVVGTFKKYIPFNNDEGWHIPQIMLDMLKERMCQLFVSEKAKNGIQVRRSTLIREFAIEVLPPLTEAELKDLAQRQAMAKQID